MRNMKNKNDGRAGSRRRPVWKSVRFVCVVLCAVSALCACAASSSAIQTEGGGVYELTVLHTNDHHGTLLSKDGKAGLAERACFIKSARAFAENVLVLDAGDINTGSALSNMFSGMADIDGYNLIGYDAVAFGNHEFDKSLSVLEAQMDRAEFAWLSCNVKRSDGSYVGRPYLVKDFGAFRAGVFGLTTLRTKVIASPDDDLVFVDEIAAAAEAVSTLREKERCDVVIALAHLGSVEEAAGQVTSIRLAESVPGIDLVIDGHSHTYFSEPLVVNGVPIVSANEWGKVVGLGTLVVTDGAVAGFRWRPVEITTAAFPPDSEMTELLRPYIEAADKSLSEVVMRTGAEFEFGDRLSRYKEIALGDMVSDAQVWYVRDRGLDVDFGLCNGGNIRAPLPAGDVTRGNLQEVLPFENVLYVLTLKGSDVLALFDFIADIPQGAGAFAQVSREVRYTITYRSDADGRNHVSHLTVGGKPVDPDGRYKIVTNDYLATGGDGYTVFLRSEDTFNTSMPLCDAVVEYVKTLPQPVMPITDGRITIVGGVEPKINTK